MGLLWFLALSMQCLLLCSLFTFTVTNCFPYVQQAQCHEGESDALLQFKESFVISKSASSNPFSYPKVASWMQNTSCCLWDGVECDEFTGYVIGLDLSSSQLYGHMNSNSSLSHLPYLEKLNLADNDFNYSQIPFRFGDLSRLKYLNLSSSKISGEIPAEISQLSKLLHLDLTCDYLVPCPQTNFLHFKNHNFRSLTQNLTNLEILSLRYVRISSSIPETLANLSSLKYLDLFSSEVYGEFPIRIFHLPNLEFLNVGYNQDLTGYLPEFPSTIPLHYLRLEKTSLHGNLPASIGNLNALNVLSVRQCKFSGSIPSSVSNLTQLVYLDLGYNKFRGNLTSSLSNLTQLIGLFVGGNELSSVTISWIGKLTRLQYLDLRTLNTGSQIPNSFANLTQIAALDMEYSNLHGQIPSWIMNLTNLYYLNLLGNKLLGQIPHSIFALKNLSVLGLNENLLTGQLELDMFLNLKRLSSLDLSDNNFSVFTRPSSYNSTLSKNIQELELGSCNINEFPNVLKDQDELEILDLSYNRIHDAIPSWMWSKNDLWYFDVSHNSLTGEISPLICNLRSLQLLDLSFNNLTGIIPPCLGSLLQNLTSLKLRSNKLFGIIPPTYMERNALKMIDLGQNNLEGQLPKALVNCSMLEYIDVSNNQINDSFPFWLGTLPEFKVLVLRSNKFSGVIRSPRTCTFPKLHIIDLSRNNFSGSIPSEIIQNWASMRASSMNQLKYEHWYHYYKQIGDYWGVNHPYSFSINNKGMLMVYERLQQFYFFIAIDLSNNKFDGEIPDVIGDLKGLVLINLSHNMFTGGIPSSLGTLWQLEALDVSHNNLSGRIPQQLTELTFLEFFDVSFNRLSGPIPQGTQFGTFQSSSFEGNQGLCVKKLLKKCEDQTRSSSALVSTSDAEQDSGSLFDFGWKVVLIGYGCGLVVGLVIGSIVSLEKHFKRR